VQPESILKRFLVLPRRLAGFCIGNIQSFSVYRKIARLFRSGIEIKEASKEELNDVHIWLHPEGTRLPIARNPNVTAFVAKKGKKVIGFVELVRSFEEDHPFRGYWIFSLTVSVLFRGMGIGELLGWKALHRAVEEGAEEISFLMREDNKRVIKLCLKHGAKIKVTPAIEELFEKERRSLGYRRVVMSKSLLGVVFEGEYVKG
jgi:ribosomal protein S18 acetylase RimI-like enzyme